MSFQNPRTELLPRHTIMIGERVEQAGTGEIWPHIYPATGQVTHELHLAGPRDVDDADRAAGLARIGRRQAP